MNGWSALAKKLKGTEDIWGAQEIVNELLESINKSGNNLSKLVRERKDFDRNKRINQSQGTTVKQDRLFNFKILLEIFEQLRNIVDEAGTQLLRKGHCDTEDIMTKLEEARSVIPDAAPSQGIPTRLDPRAMDVPAHKHGRINPNDELEKHPPRPDAINSKPERGKAGVDKFECAASSLPTMPATEEPEKDKDAVALWKFVAESLLTMQSGQLKLDDDSEEDIWKLAARHMLETQPGHGSERALPGIDFIAIQNEERGRGRITVVALQQMERLLSGIPDARAVAIFILSHLPEKDHALLSCTTIFSEEHTSVWRNHILFEGWPEEESGAFACEYSRLVPGSWTIPSVLEKWHGLLEVSCLESSLTIRANKLCRFLIR